MLPQFHRTSRMAVIGVVVLAIGVSACGRRGALGPPPSAAATAAGHAGATALAQDTVEESKSTKPFFLDFLL